MSCDDCLNRRAFFAKSALAAATLVIAEACGDGQIGPPIPHISGGGDPNVPLTTVAPFNVSKFPALANVGTVVDIGSQRAVIRTGAATFLGLSRICTHQQCDTEVTNNRFECPCHGSIFAADGAVVRGPNIQAPPNTPLRQLTCTFDAASGTITIA
ncbi:MAG: Rieske 2Fe-2S domain-containing protein [bacterium]